MGDSDNDFRDWRDPVEGPLPPLHTGVVIGVIAGMLTVGLVWLLVALVGGDSNAIGQAPPGGTSSRLLGQDVSADRAAATRLSRLDRCRRAAARLADPLDAARPAMDQWEVHVGAMNKLVVGAITLQQATDFWNQTRMGAHHHIDAFRQALRPVVDRGVDCPTPARLGAGARPPVRACVRRVAADERVLATARTAVTTWARHVEAMDMLRMGHLSPAEATRMWLSMWRRGQAELEAYRAADRTLEGAGTC